MVNTCSCYPVCILCIECSYLWSLYSSHASINIQQYPYHCYTYWTQMNTLECFSYPTPRLEIRSTIDIIYDHVTSLPPRDNHPSRWNRADLFLPNWLSMNNGKSEDMTDVFDGAMFLSHCRWKNWIKWHSDRPKRWLQSNGLCNNGPGLVLIVMIYCCVCNGPYKI